MSDRLINPLIPMLAITGNPTSEKMRNMLESYKSVGIDAVLLYPRSGLEIEYMSEKWRQFCEEILRIAIELDMKIWLYDEFNWPSGSCKNAVAKADPSYAAKRFVYKDGCVSVDVMKPGDAQRVFEPFDSDMLNPMAIQCFIRLTHEKYYEWFGQYFGNVIPGIFTDEPSFIYTSNEDGMYPYYEGVEEDYQKVCGRDLKSDIIAFEEGQESPCFPGVFRQVIGKRFRECYIAPIAAWCKEHNLLLTGHTLEDERPLSGTEVTGDWFAFMEEMDVPGVDEIPTQMCDKDDMLFGMIENMRYNGKESTMAELFALGPCSMSTARRRQFLWYAAAHGVNRYFIAISHMDGKGNIRKPDFFDNFNNYNFDFDAIRFLAKEAQMAAEFSEKRVWAPIGVRCAYETYLKALGRRMENEVAARFASLIHTLTIEQISWRMLREEEANECEIVLNLDGTTIIEERTGQQFDDIEKALTWIRSQYQGPYVTTRDGGKVQNLRVKVYEDGSVVVVDYENEPKGRREYILHMEDKEISFHLESFGVAVFHQEMQSNHQELPVMREESLQNLRVVHNNSHIYRCVFLQEEQAEFEVTEEMTVRMYRREYQGGDGVILDGEPLDFILPCNELTGCFSELYRGVEVYLTKGRHQICTGMKDYAYLPAVVICGNFTSKEDILMPTNDSKQPFFGEIQVMGIMVPPKEAKECYVCMEDCQLYVTATIGNEEIGACAFAPYCFKIPEKYYGRETEITFTFHTSLAPIFGDLKTMKEQGVFAPDWAEVPASTSEEIDIQKLKMRGKSI